VSLAAALLVLLTTQFQSGDTLEALRFEGNRSFNWRVLMEKVQSRKGKPATESRIARDASDLEKFYNDQGFYAAVVDRVVAPGRRRWVLRFVVSEGPRARIDSVLFTGNSAFDTERLAAVTGLKTGQPAAGGVTTAGENAVRTLYQNSGYAFADVKGELRRVDSSAVVEFRVDEGPLCYVESIAFVGLKKARPGTCRTVAELRVGERYSRQRLFEAQRRLYASKLFSRVSFSVAAVDSVRDSVRVRFDVAEQGFHSVGLGGGGEINPGVSPLRLLLSLDWENDNFLGRNHTLLLSTEYGQQIIGPSFRVGGYAAWRIPYFGRTRVDFQTRPFVSLDRPDTLLLREYGIETGLSRSVLPQLTFGLANRLRLVSDTASGITNSIALSGQLDTRNDIFEPTRGGFARGVAEVAGGILQGTNDFYRLTADVRGYQELFGGLVLAARLGAGRVYPYRPGELVAHHESFTLGGATSLRGYPDRSVGPFGDSTARYGFAMLNGSVELRSPYAFRLVGLAAFFDAGNLSRYFPPRELLVGAGVGLRVRTPIGPARLDWGKALTDPQPGDWGKLYLGLLHAF
jgi:outer membrane protein insertion porin family